MWRDLFTGVLSVFMVLDCILLVMLVLLQLPKKEAGAGLAFGGAATDALFGAGSGNVLTKITKWVATLFFALAFTLAVVGKPVHTSTSVAEKLANKPAPVSSAPATPAAPSADNLLKTVPQTTQPAEKPVAPAPATTPAAAPSTNK